MKYATDRLYRFVFFLSSVSLLFVAIVSSQKSHSQHLLFEAKGPQRFSDSSIDNASYIELKDKIRQRIMSRPSGTWPQGATPSMAAGIGNGHSRVEDIVDNRPVLKNLQIIQDEGLTAAALRDNPWSDHYWPIYNGILGARYGDQTFPSNSDWKLNFDFIKLNPVTAILKDHSEDSHQLLSPSEKYDLLLGMDNQRLTQNSWNQGKQYYDRDNKIETWMGICHGWAPAAYMLPRALRKITLPLADGNSKVTFYPSDIKALASLLWAEAQSPVRFVGGRCNDKNPETDANGRIISENCFDTNPGLWHLAVVNQIGVAKRSLVIDATYDYEVWNQPLLKYSYRYFNPQTNKAVDTLEKATVAVSDLSNDKYKAYRAPESKFVVGINMTIHYMVEIHPRQNETDSADYDAVRSARYSYDLELDADSNVIGGEWHSTGHPDFLWTPPPGAKALSYGDYYILNDPLWNGKKALNETWKKAGLGAARSGQPLGRLVESLINLSRQSEEN